MLKNFALISKPMVTFEAMSDNINEITCESSEGFKKGSCQLQAKVCTLSTCSD